MKLFIKPIFAFLTCTTLASELPNPRIIFVKQKRVKGLIPGAQLALLLKKAGLEVREKGVAKESKFSQMQLLCLLGYTHRAALELGNRNLKYKTIGTALQNLNEALPAFLAQGYEEEVLAHNFIELFLSTFLPTEQQAEQIFEELQQAAIPELSRTKSRDQSLAKIADKSGRAGVAPNDVVVQRQPTSRVSNCVIL